MKLTAKHRRALLDSLSDTTAQIARIKETMQSPSIKEDEGVLSSLEISEFLATVKVKAIEAALVEDDIDY